MRLSYLYGMSFCEADEANLRTRMITYIGSLEFRGEFERAKRSPNRPRPRLMIGATMMKPVKNVMNTWYIVKQSQSIRDHCDPDAD